MHNIFGSTLGSADWVSAASLIVAAASCVAALASFIVAVASLKVAKRSMEVADDTLRISRETMKQNGEDWKQRKWFDLYFKADHAYNLLDYYQTFYKSNPIVSTERRVSDWSELMLAVRQAHTSAAVFPKNQLVDNLFESTKFSDQGRAMEAARLSNLMNAVEGLRQKALLNVAIL